MDASTLINKLDTVIGKIAKSKKFHSVRILEEVKRELILNGVPEGHSGVPAAPSERFVPPAVSEVLKDGEAPYIAQNGEVDDLICYIMAGENVLLTGPTGCGKTHLLEHVSRKLGKTLGTIQGQDGCTAADIIGFRELENGNTVFHHGVLPVTMTTEGGILYWDEPNFTPAGIQTVCWSAMDHRRQIVIPENKGEVIKAKKGFTVIGSMNEGKGYRGTQVLNAAFRARWGGIINLDYLPEARERKLLVDRTGIDPDTADKLTKAAKQLRASLQRGDITTPISTRTLLSACNAVRHGAPILRAIELSVHNQVSAAINTTEYKAVADVLEAYFPRKAAKGKSKDEVPF
jgi:nitric oxide reductase NorQ protein